MRVSIGTGVILMAIGGVLAFAVRAPAEVEQYIDVIDLGLILIWAGVLVLGIARHAGAPHHDHVGAMPTAACEGSTTGRPTASCNGLR